MRWKDMFSPITHMDTTQINAFIESQAEGTYTLLDVRQPAEYEKVRKWAESASCLSGAWPVGKNPVLHYIGLRTGLL